MSAAQSRRKRLQTSSAVGEISPTEKGSEMAHTTGAIMLEPTAQLISDWPKRCTEDATLQSTRGHLPPQDRHPITLG